MAEGMGFAELAAHLEAQQEGSPKESPEAPSPDLDADAIEKAEVGFEKGPELQRVTGLVAKEHVGVGNSNVYANASETNYQRNPDGRDEASQERAEHYEDEADKLIRGESDLDDFVGSLESAYSDAESNNALVTAEGKLGALANPDKPSSHELWTKIVDWNRMFAKPDKTPEEAQEVMRIKEEIADAVSGLDPELSEIREQFDDINERFGIALATKFDQRVDKPDQKSLQGKIESAEVKSRGRLVGRKNTLLQTQRLAESLDVTEKENAAQMERLNKWKDNLSEQRFQDLIDSDGAEKALAQITGFIERVQGADDQGFLKDVGVDPSGAMFLQPDQIKQAREEMLAHLTGLLENTGKDMAA